MSENEQSHDARAWVEGERQGEAELRTELSLLRMALRFYADPANYHAVYDPQNDYWFAVLDDEGATARAVLPEYHEKGEV